MTRYGFKHWMHAKWPLPLLEAMFEKYTAIVSRESNKDKDEDKDGNKDTKTIEQVAIWLNIIDKKRTDAVKCRTTHLISILY
jgi:hypothetical protein